MKKEEPKGPVHSVGKAMELLELFFLWRKPMSLRQIAEATQYPKSTIHSLLSTLRERRGRAGCERMILSRRAAVRVRLCGDLLVGRARDCASAS